MGDFDPEVLALEESSLRYHSFRVGVLTTRHNISGGGTVSGREFDWGGRLRKCIGGAQRFPQAEWKSAKECKGRRELDCETYKSNRDESRA